MPMKRSNAVSTLSCLLILTTGFLTVDAASLRNLLGAGSYSHQWEPFIPCGYDSNIIRLHPGQSLDIDIPSASGLKISSPDPLDSLVIYSATVPNIPPFTRTLTSVGFLTDSAGDIIVPTGITTATTFVLSSPGSGPELHLFQAVSDRKPYYWDKVASCATREFEEGTFIPLINSLSQAVESSDDYSLPGLWIRMMRNAVESSVSRESPEQSIGQAIDGISRMFGILAQEDTSDRPFEPPHTGSSEFTRIDTADDPDIAWRIPSSRDITVRGPVWLLLSIRVERTLTPSTSMFELPFSLTIDGRRTGYWPENTCRFLTDSYNFQFSSPVRFNVFIPGGRHSLRIDAGSDILVSGVERRPLFPGFPDDIEWLSINPLDHIPVQHLIDTGWMNNQYLKGGDQPILQRFADYYSARYRWQFIQGAGNPIRRLEADSRPVRAAAAQQIPDAPEPLHGLYLVPDGTPTRLMLPVSGDREVYSIDIIDADRMADDSPPIIEIDDRPVLHPDLMDPFTAVQKISLPISAGTHELMIDAGGRHIYCDQPLDGVTADPLEFRLYYPCGPQSDPTGTSFRVNGGQFGAPARFYYHQPSALPFDILLDGYPWLQVKPGPAQSPDSISGIAVLPVPAGRHILSVICAEPSLVTVAQPAWLTLQSQSPIHADPLLQTVLDALDSSSQDDAINHLHALDPDATIEKTLWLALAGDPVRAKDILFDSDYDETVASHRIILAWILAETGYDYRAVDTFNPLLQDRIIPYSSRLYHRMLDAALCSGALQSAISIASVIRKNNDDDEWSSALLGGTDGFAGAHVADINSLVHSRTPRWLPIPTDRIECRSSGIRLMDRWSTPDLPVVKERDPSLYWLLESGESMQINLVEPAVVRLLIRAPAAESLDRSGAPAILTIDRPTMKICLPVPPASEDRETLSWEGSTSIPGRPDEWILPITEAGMLTITCSGGCLAVKPWVQVISMADVLELSRPEQYNTAADALNPVFSVSGQMQNSVETYIDLMRSGLRDGAACQETPPDLSTLYTGLCNLAAADPGFNPARSLKALLERSLEWKHVSGWPQAGHERVYLAPRRLPNDTVVRIRSMDVPEPLPSAESHLLMLGRRVDFDPSDLPGGSLIFRAGFTPSAGFTVLIEADRRGVGCLTPENPEYTMVYAPGSINKLSILASSVSGLIPIKIGVEHRSNGITRRVPLAGNRRYNRLAPSQKSGIGGDIIAPCCLRLELRTAKPGDTGQSVAVEMSRSGQDNAGRFITNLSAQVDDDYFDTVTGQPVGQATCITIPVTERGVYHLAVKPLNPAGSPVLVRCSAVRYTTMDSGADAMDCRIEPPQLLEEPKESAIAADDRPDNVWPVTEWNRPTRSAGANAGTWLFDVSYRNRDRNTDPESDGSTVYGGDGPGAAIGLQKRIDAFGGRQRIYLDGTLGATYSPDKPDGVTGYVTHNLNWFVPGGATRLTWSLESATQTIDDDNVWRYKLQTDVRRSIDITPRISLTGSIGGFITRQSLDPDDVRMMENRPHPILYTDFDQRHDAGGILRLFVSARPMSICRIYGYSRVITAGDGESGLFGPWWAGIGLDSILGPVMVSLSYDERQSFGDSPEPDRSRVQASITGYHWQGANSLWDINLFHRYTLDEDWHDTGVTVSLRFNRGQLLRDADPFRVVFRERIEALTE